MGRWPNKNYMGSENVGKKWFLKSSCTHEQKYCGADHDTGVPQIGWTKLSIKRLQFTTTTKAISRKHNVISKLLILVSNQQHVSVNDDNVLK